MNDKDQLIELSLLCLQASLVAIQEQEENKLQSSSHTTCTSFECKIDSVDKLNAYLKGYIRLLSDVIFKKNAKLGKDWWLSVFYSFCIQSFVRGALLTLVSKFDVNQITAVSQYLHIAVNLFFVICNATGKGYDPLSYDFHNLSVVETFVLTRSYLRVEDGRLAQIAVQNKLWELNGIDSSYDYLGQLFGMDRTIFVPSAAKPLACNSGSKTIAVGDEQIQPLSKEQYSDQQNEESYSNNDLIATQCPDTHIIHPGSLALFNSTAELPPPIPDDKKHCIFRENPIMFEGDMYTPRWVRKIRDEEGWCGFCSR